MSQYDHMPFDRRRFLGSALAAGAAGVVPAVAASERAAAAADQSPKRYQNGVSPWPVILNSAVIRPAPLQEKLKATAAAGWDGIELWVSDLEAHEKDGGKLEDLGKQIRDMGLYVPNIIGLWECMPPTQEAFDAAMAATRNRMRMSAAVGSEFVAAIPAPDRADFDLAWGSHCYRELMRIGRNDYNIKVAFEFVGFFKGVYRMGQAAGIALDTDDPAACLIMDTFHLFRGNSGFNGIKLIQPDLIANFHWNDVPGDIPREKQGDEHRLYPGDGILPLTQVLKDLKAIGYRRTLSLEIFHREYWKQDPKLVAVNGLNKMRECIAKAGV
jgi:sugar phosphate isomerase/epimerase